MRLLPHQIEQKNKAGIAVVHVDNFEDMEAGGTVEEYEPEHFDTYHFNPLPIGMPTGGVTVLLEQDRLRVEATIRIITSPVVICHSLNQANTVANNVATNSTDGARIDAGTTLKIRGTGPLWVVGVSGTPIVSVIVSRRAKVGR